MALWGMMISFLAIFIVISIYLNFPIDLPYAAALGILLSVVGIFYRVWVKTTEGRMEKLEKEVNELRKKIEEK